MEEKRWVLLSAHNLQIGDYILFGERCFMIFNRTRAYALLQRIERPSFTPAAQTLSTYVFQPGEQFWTLR